MADGKVAARTGAAAPRDWGRWRDYRAMQFSALSDAQLAACATCGRPTDKTSTKRCDGCWEVEHRLDSYLRDGGLAARSVLVSALHKSGVGP
jgi:hypothetical protein